MQMILTKVFKSSSLFIVAVVLILCLICKWPLFMIMIAMLASIAISSPATVSLHLMMWLYQKINLERGFAWMMLFTSIPLLSFITACLFDHYVPGKVWFLLPLGMLGGYVGIFSQAFAIAKLFNSDKDEREENYTID